MPPEQAEGKSDLIDHRSDIYSLGAILYEILTLKRPVEGKSLHQILLNVADGKTVPPEQRAPDRNIPKELSAITMKAMEKNRRRRYQSVMELSKDISLFLEGRSVSAKDDSAVEALSKLIKRNKTASILAGIALVFLLAITGVFILRLNEQKEKAIAERNTARAALESAEVARKKQTETALSASQQLAKQAIRAEEEGRMAEADVRAGPP
jgi:serine/threonine protein kinase